MLLLLFQIPIDGIDQETKLEHIFDQSKKVSLRFIRENSKSSDTFFHYNPEQFLPEIC